MISTFHDAPFILGLLRTQGDRCTGMPNFFWKKILSFVWMDVALPKNFKFNSEIIYIFYVISCQPLGCRDMPQ